MGERQPHPNPYLKELDQLQAILDEKYGLLAPIQDQETAMQDVVRYSTLQLSASLTAYALPVHPDPVERDMARDNADRWYYAHMNAGNGEWGALFFLINQDAASYLEDSTTEGAISGMSQPEREAVERRGYALKRLVRTAQPPKEEQV